MMVLVKKYTCMYLEEKIGQLGLFNLAVMPQTSSQSGAYFKEVGSILVSGCPSICACMHPSVYLLKKLSQGFEV